MKEEPCPFCHVGMVMAGMPALSAPNPGLCTSCSEPIVITPDHKLRKPTDDEYLRWHEDGVLREISDHAAGIRKIKDTGRLRVLDYWETFRDNALDDIFGSHPKKRSMQIMQDVFVLGIKAGLTIDMELVDKSRSIEDYAEMRDHIEKELELLKQIMLQRITIREGTQS